MLFNTWLPWCAVQPDAVQPSLHMHVAPMLAGPEGEEVASQLVGVAPATWCLQQLLAEVNATCPATYGDAGGRMGGCWLHFLACWLQVTVVRNLCSSMGVGHAGTTSWVYPRCLCPLCLLPRPAELAFIARLPPLGYSTFYLEPQQDSSCTPASNSQAGQRSCGGGLPSTSSAAKAAKASSGASRGGKYEKLDNGLVALEFDTETGAHCLRWDACC